MVTFVPQFCFYFENEPRCSRIAPVDQRTGIRLPDHPDLVFLFTSLDPGLRIECYRDKEQRMTRMYHYLLQRPTLVMKQASTDDWRDIREGYNAALQKAIPDLNVAFGDKFTFQHAFLLSLFDYVLDREIDDFTKSTHVVGQWICVDFPRGDFANRCFRRLLKRRVMPRKPCKRGALTIRLKSVTQLAWGKKCRKLRVRCLLAIA